MSPVIESWWMFWKALWIVERDGVKIEMSDAGYSSIFCLCVGPTSFHVRKHPLREEDTRVVRTMKKRGYHIANTQI